jgi:hypothetical protein
MLRNLLKASYGDKKSSRELESQGLIKDKSLSGKRVQVYKDDEGNAQVVHRGTQGVKDFVTDAYITLGGDLKKTNRYKHANKITQQAREKYGNINISGHSLGGKLAEMTGKSGDKSITTVNKASVFGDIGKRRRDNQVDIRHKNDLVSMISTTQKGGRVKTLKNKTKNALTANSTDNLKFI